VAAERDGYMAHYLGTDDEGNDIYAAEDAEDLTARGWEFWADEDGLLHVTGPAKTEA
jgi:hypothetical protein